MEQTDPTPSQVLLKAIGGQAAIARECDVSEAAVSYWATSGIPKSWLRYLRLAHPGSHWDEFDASAREAA